MTGTNNTGLDFLALVTKHVTRKLQNQLNLFEKRVITSSY